MSGFVFMASVILFFFSAYRLRILGSWFRVLGIVLSTLLVSSLLLAFLNLPVRPEPFAGILGLFSVAMLYHSSRKKSGSRTDARTDRLSKDAIVALIAVLICVVAGVVYFRQDFLLPQYISIDAAVHFMLGKYVSTNDTLLVFQRDLFFPDSPHIAQYPFGAGVLFSLFSEVLFFLPSLVSFQIFHIFLLAITSGYFIFVFLSRLHITSAPLRMLAVLMISLGGFFNLMIMGFTSQLAGVFFLIFLYDVYTAYRSQIGTIVLAALAIFSVFATYLYWIPVVFLFLAAQTVLAVDFRAIGTSLKKLAVPVGSGLLAILLALPYAYEVVSSGLLGVAGNDGGAYKVFLLNFVLYLPLLIAALPFFVREFFVKRSSAISFLASAVVFTCVLAAMFYSDNASGYTFSKSFMLTLPALYLLSISGMQTIVDQLKGWSRWAFIAGFVTVTLVFVIGPFFFPNENYTPATTDSFGMNTGSAEGQLFDLFYTNGQAVCNENFHMVNFSRDTNEFMNNLAQNISDDPLGSGRVPDKLSVVSDFTSTLWFYAITDIWPRSLESAMNFWDFRFVPYDEWLDSDSEYLILLEGSDTKRWMKEHDFDPDDLVEVFRHGHNVLYRKPS